MVEFSFWEILVFISIIWIIVRGIIAIKDHSISWLREAKMLLVYVCIVVIVRTVMFPMHHVDGHIDTLKFDPEQVWPLWYNLIPIYHLFDIYDGWQINIIGNILLFVPVGIVWPFCFKELDSIKKTILAGAGFTFIIEILQIPLFERCSDIDDLILNTTGVAIGALIYFTRKKKKGIIIMGLLTVLSTMFGCAKTQPVSVDIKSLYFGESGYSIGYSYDITSDEDKPGKYVMIYDDPENGYKEKKYKLDEDTMNKISTLCKDIDINSWDKFKESAENVLDGSGFTLRIEYTDGTQIYAQGDNSFPKHFYDFVNGMREIMMPVVE